MKKIFFILALLSVLLIPVFVNFSPVYASAQSGRTITVMGSGLIYAVPDVAIVSLGVETSDKDLVAAQKENYEKLDSLLKLLEENGIEKEKIRTSGFNVYQQYDYKTGKNLVGYQIVHNLEFKTNDLENVGAIIAALIKNGANSFQSVRFAVENQNELYEQALSKCIENARQKAEILTGSKNLHVISITEENVFNSYRMYDTSNFVYAKASGENVFSRGEINISAEIKVIFEY